jgi:hypothetical protein
MITTCNSHVIVRLGVPLPPIRRLSQVYYLPLSVATLIHHVGTLSPN